VNEFPLKSINPTTPVAHNSGARGGLFLFVFFLISSRQRAPRSDFVLTMYRLRLLLPISHWIPVWLSVHSRFRHRKHVTPTRRSGSRSGSKAKGSRLRRGSFAAVLTCGARGGRFASLGLVGALNGSKRAFISPPINEKGVELRVCCVHDLGGPSPDRIASAGGTMTYHNNPSVLLCFRADLLQVVMSKPKKWGGSTDSHSTGLGRYWFGAGCGGMDRIAGGDDGKITRYG
jgi:hypothetical protein